VASHLTLGKRGEKLAAQFMESEGYLILNCNYKPKKYEIDIIAIKKDILVFVEVKTRSSDYFGDPAESVTPKKENHIAEAAAEFIENYKGEYMDIRYDIISIIIDGSSIKINHIEDAFFPRNF